MDSARSNDMIRVPFCLDPSLRPIPRSRRVSLNKMAGWALDPPILSNSIFLEAEMGWGNYVASASPSLARSATMGSSANTPLLLPGGGEVMCCVLLLFGPQIDSGGRSIKCVRAHSIVPIDIVQRTAHIFATRDERGCGDFSRGATLGSLPKK